jgi:hypothetical protein
MSQGRVPLAAIAIALLSLGASVGATPRPVAQEGTPPVGEEFPAGLSFEPLAFGVAEELPTVPAGLSLFRVTLAPGTGLPIEADDPSVGLVYIEAGSLTAQVGASIGVLRGTTATAMGGGGAEPETEEVAAGTEFILEAGDSTVFPPNVAGDIRNDGAVQAVALAALIEPLHGEDADTPAP